jgi:hypothetical protein
MGDSLSQGRYLHTRQYTQNKHTHIFMPKVGTEPTTIEFEMTKQFMPYSVQPLGSAIGKFALHG